MTPVRQAFQHVFGRATVFGVAVEGSSTIANQPVGFAAGRQAAQERISFVRNKAAEQQEPLVVLAVEGFLLEASTVQFSIDLIPKKSVRQIQIAFSVSVPPKLRRLPLVA